MGLTEQPSSHGLQHSEDGKEVQRRVDALEAIRLAQTAGDLLDQQGTQQHHQHQAEGVIDQDDGVAKAKRVERSAPCNQVILPDVSRNVHIKEHQTSVLLYFKVSSCLQWIDRLLGAVQGVDVVGTGVVQHGVPV